MLRYIRIANIFLIVCVGFFAYNLYRGWFLESGKTLEVIGAEIKDNKTSGRAPKNASKKGVMANKFSQNFGFYQDVIERNLFRADRQNPHKGERGEGGEGGEDGEGGEGGEGGAQSRKRGAAGGIEPGSLVLYGVAHVGHEKVAVLGYVSNESASKLKVEKVRMVKVGESIATTKVKDIKESSIIVEVGKEIRTMNVHDPKDPKLRKRLRTEPTRREEIPVSTQAGGAQPQSSSQSQPLSTPTSPPPATPSATPPPPPPATPATPTTPTR